MTSPASWRPLSPARPVTSHTLVLPQPFNSASRLAVDDVLPTSFKPRTSHGLPNGNWSTDQILLDGPRSKRENALKRTFGDMMTGLEKYARSLRIPRGKDGRADGSVNAASTSRVAKLDPMPKRKKSVKADAKCLRNNAMDTMTSLSRSDIHGPDEALVQDSDSGGNSTPDSAIESLEPRPRRPDDQDTPMPDWNEQQDPQCTEKRSDGLRRLHSMARQVSKFVSGENSGLSRAHTISDRLTARPMDSSDEDAVEAAQWIRGGSVKDRRSSKRSSSARPMSRASSSRWRNTLRPSTASGPTHRPVTAHSSLATLRGQTNRSITCARSPLPNGEGIKFPAEAGAGAKAAVQALAAATQANVAGALATGAGQGLVLSDQQRQLHSKRSYASVAKSPSNSSSSLGSSLGPLPNANHQPSLLPRSAGEARKSRKRSSVHGIHHDGSSAGDQEGAFASILPSALADHMYASSLPSCPLHEISLPKSTLNASHNPKQTHSSNIIESCDMDMDQMNTTRDDSVLDFASEVADSPRFGRVVLSSIARLYLTFTRPHVQVSI